MRSAPLFSVSVVIVFACSVPSLVGAPPDAGVERGQAVLSRLPLRFEANQGQWNPSVRYAARGGGYELAFGEQGPSLRFGGSQAINISLVDSNRRPVIEGLDALPVRTNYM